jgi:hypothetical protein
MKNQALESYTGLYKKRNEFRATHAQVFNEFDKIYQALQEAELDLKDEIIRVGHDLQNGTVHGHYINGNPDNTIKPRARIEIVSTL